MKLIMTKGLPASGKSTWAKTQNAKRINRDDLRSMIDNGKWSKDNEKFIVKLEQDIAVFYLGGMYDVIIDDTNLSPKNELMWKTIAEVYKATFEIKDFTDVPLEECIKRDQKRTNYVGEKVIRSMYKQFLQPKAKLQVINDNLPTCVICDLDGTLALLNGRDPYNAETCLTDSVNMPIYELLNRVKEDRTILLVSGRQDLWREQTLKWLKINGISYDYLFMRKAGDMRKDSIVKQEIYDSQIKGKYNVLFVLDDRNQVVDMWRANGLPCLQVNYGDF